MGVGKGYITATWEWDALDNGCVTVPKQTKRGGGRNHVKQFSETADSGDGDFASGVLPFEAGKTLNAYPVDLRREASTRV